MSRVGALAGIRVLLCESSRPLDNPLGAEHYLDRWVPAESFHFQAAVVAPATTDEGGRFSIDSVRPGSLFLSLDEEDDDLPDVQWPFVVRREDPPRSLELTLDRGLMIEGTVLAPDGRPVKGVGLGVARQDKALHALSEWTNRDGTFRLGPFVAGSYSVHAAGCEEPLLAPSEAVVATAGGPPVLLTMRWGGHLRVELVDEQGRTIEGNLAGVGVVGGARLFRRGKLQVIGGMHWEGLLPDTYDVYVATRDGRIGIERDIVVTPRTVVDVDIRVGESARVSIPEDLDVSVVWNGLEVPRALEREFVVPPGETTIHFFRFAADGERELVHRRSRTLAAGEKWHVEEPP